MSKTKTKTKAKAKATENKRPTRDEFELEDLAYELGEAMGEKKDVVLTVFGIGKVKGKITKMDGYTKLIHVEGYEGLKKVPFLDILKVDTLG